MNENALSAIETSLVRATNAIEKVEEYAGDSDNPNYWVKHLSVALWELKTAVEILKIDANRPNASTQSVVGSAPARY